MSIAAAINQNAQSVATAQNQYQASFYAVNSQMVTVSSSDLPTLQNTPTNWQDFLTANTDAKSAALSWFNTVSAPLISDPQSIAGYDTAIEALLGAVGQEAGQLAATPTDAALLNLFVENLNSLNGELELIQVFINGALSAIQVFDSTSLPQATSDLQTLVSDYSAQVNADQAQVQQLTTDIANLQQDIDNQIQDIVQDLIIAAGAVFVSRLAPGWTPTSCLVKFLAAVTLSLATYHIILDSEQIATDKAKIDIDNQQITSYTADVAACQLQVQNFQSLVKQMAVVSQDLQTLATAWQALQSDVKAAIADITDAVTKAGGASPDFSTISSDIANATTEWKALVAAAGTMVVKVTVNTAQLEPGMNQDQIASATGAAQTVDLITFVNAA